MTDESLKKVKDFEEAYKTYMQSVAIVEDLKLGKTKKQEITRKLKQVIIHSEITLDHIQG